MLAIDVETYSSIDLVKCGVYAYKESVNFEILLFAYAYDDNPIEIIDLACAEKLPQDVIEDLTNPKVIKTAFNSNFERTCLSKYLSKPMPPEQWRCSAVHSLELGLSTSLDKVAKCMNLEQQKMSEGKALLRYFSMPCKPTKANGGRTRNLPQHGIEKWEIFKRYCKQDVEVERTIRKKLDRYPVVENEWRLWALDQRINDGGVKIDKLLANNAIKFDEAYKNQKIKEAAALTNLENPNSPSQLKKWLQTKGLKIESLSKEKVKELLGEVEDPSVKRVLELRQELSKTSVKKYEAIGSVRNSIESGINNALNYLAGLPGRAWSYGADFVNGIVNGIRSAVGRVEDAVSALAAKIRSYLHFSVPDEGPLTDYEKWMPDFMAGLAEGINKSKHIVAEAVNGLSLDMKVNSNIAEMAVPASNNSKENENLKNKNGFTLHIENFINNTEKDIEQLAYELEFYRQKISMGKGGV
ncbi:hypothetical protein [Clostridium tyrobutyricum]|uniref:hypothetical protein n=1 Tax=Clostridium tyrobutyricum TaxID=1519 RepID=UPI0020CEEF69|nr:hypothetical protein [Clostridium tyrobutyricum]